jgi:hypothetical protein
VTLKNCNAKNSQMFVFLTSGPHHLKKQNKTRITKTSQTVNKNNPAQNFFSIAQFPTKKQTKHPFCPFYNQKNIHKLYFPVSIIFCEFSPEKETVIIIVTAFFEKYLE